MFNGSINTLLLEGNDLYAGGNFTTYRGTAVERIVKLDLDAGGGLNPAWTTGLNSGAISTVNRIVGDSSSLFVGGSFTRYRSAVANVERLIKIQKSDGQLAAGWPTGTNI